MAAMKAQG